MRPSGGLTGLVLAVSAFACTSRWPRPSRLEREFQRYLSLPNQKVFVIAGDPDGEWVGSYGYAARSQLEAQDLAMEQCNVRKKTLSSPSECVVYAIGREIVWKRPE